MQSGVIIVNVDHWLLYSRKKVSFLSPSRVCIYVKVVHKQYTYMSVASGQIYVFLVIIGISHCRLFCSELPLDLTCGCFIRWCRRLHLCCASVILSVECQASRDFLLSNIWAMAVVRRIIGKIIITVLCCIVYCIVFNNMHTYNLSSS